MQKFVIFVKKIEDKHPEDKKYCKFRDHSCFTGEYRGATHNICTLNYNVPKEIPIIFHNGSNCDLSYYHKRTIRRI